MKEILAFFFFLNIFTFSQEGTFEGTYTEGIGQYVKEAPDGGYLVASTSPAYSNDTLIKLDISKFDLQGNLLWTMKNVTNASDSYKFDVSKTGDIYVPGYTLENNKDIELVKLDKNGNIIWKKTFGKSDTLEIGLAVKLTSDNRILLVGRTKTPQTFYRYNFEDFIFLMLDETGNPIWEKRHPFSRNYLSFYGENILELSDSSYVIMERGKMLRISKEGTILWETPSDFIGYSIVKKNESEIFVGSLGNINRYDLNGNLISSNTFSGRITNIVPAFSQNNFVVSRLIGSSSIVNYLTLISEKGDSLKSYKFPGEIKSLIRTSDSKLLFTGLYYRKIWLVKTDSTFLYRSIFLKTPLSGNKLKIASPFLVTWSSINTSGNFKLELSTNRGYSWETAVSSIPDSGKFFWNPLWVISSECRLKISDVLFPNTFSESDIFSILPAIDKDTLSINNIKMWVTNSAQYSHDPLTDGSGFYWPSEAPHALIYDDGFIWSGKVNGEIRANGSTYSSGVVPGNILQNGNPADKTDLRFSVWKYRKDESSLSQFQKEVNDYNFINWPGDIGAPFIDEDNDGIYTKGNDKPKMHGDETAFFVVNDLDTTVSQYFAGSDPIGLEFQHTVCAFNDNELLNDVLFRNVKIINKSSYQIDSMFVGFWSDGDLGYAGDDYFGCDSSLNLAYFYNGDNYDEVDYNRGYGLAPPSFGYEVLRGGIAKGSANDSVFIDGKWKKESTDLGMTTFISIIKHANSVAPTDWPQGSYRGSLEMFNLMSGRINSGLLFIGQKSGKPLGHFPFSGDPETQTGMVEGMDSEFPMYPDDRRLALSSGPFTFAPGDTQNITIATIVARGSSNLNSVTKLKEKAKLVQQYFDESLIKEEEKRKASIPTQFELFQNYPNPFNPVTSINYSLTEKSFVNLTVYDILGDKVITLVNEMKNFGRHKVEFSASNYGLSSGVYFYRLQAGNASYVKKMIILK